MYQGHYQTMRLSFEQICQGERVWNALGNFMNDWYAYHLDERERLVVDALPDAYPQAFHQWAAFCAASVRWFCSTYEIACPLWVNHERYVLPEPWYMDAPSILWDRMRETTAEEFVRHNISCGNRLYINKYERDEQGRLLRAHPVDLQERRILARGATARLVQKRAEERRQMEEVIPLLQARRIALAEQ